MSQPSLQSSAFAVDIPNPMKVENVQTTKSRKIVKVPHHYEDEELVAAAYSPPVASGFTFDFKKQKKNRLDDPIQDDPNQRPHVSKKQPQASLLTALSGQYKAEQAKKISAEVLRQKLNTAPAKGKPRGAIYEDIEGDHFEDEKSKTAYTAFKTHQRSQSSPNSPKVIRQDRLAALGPGSAPVEEQRPSWFSEAPPAPPPDNNMAMERRRPSWFASLFSAQDVGIIAERYEAHMASEKDQADGDKGVKDNPLPSEPQFFHQKSDGSFFNDPQPKQPTRKECQEKLSIRDFNVFSPTSM